MRYRRLPLCWLALLLVGAAGCTRGANRAGDLFGPPGEVEIAGEWSTTTTEVRDTCGFDPLPAASPLLVEDAGERAVLTYLGPGGSCEQTVRVRSGAYVTLDRTDVVETSCGAVLVQSHITYVFDENSFAGTADHFYSNLSGACSNLPCEYELSIAGTRCNGCWPGCS